MNTSFPAQKLPDSKKTKEWFKQNIDAVDSSGFFLDEGVRASHRNRRINYNLYNGILDMSDVLRTLNPNDVQGLNTEGKIQHYPIAVPRLNVLIGEELKRRFDYRVIITNPDSISLKEEEKLKVYLSKVQEFLQSNYAEKELEEKFKEFENHMIYDWQDHREIIANKILRHLYQELKLNLVFNDGFKDAILAGEEYYMTEIVSGEPILKKLDTESVFWVRSGFSNKIEDSDLIVIDEYWSPGKIIDNYFDVLRPSEMDTLQRGFFEGTSSGNPYRANNEPPMVLAESNEDIKIIEGLIDAASSGNTLNRAYDQHGNYRVLRVFWRSWRRVKKVKYFDEFGDEQFEYFPDKYKVDESKGETYSYVWINEWLEGTKIGDNIYTNLRPKPIQYHKLDNPSYCHPGITGRAYSTNRYQTVSLMDRLKHYQYMYDVTWDRLNKLLANHRGKVLVMDFSIIPQGWEPEQWFSYLTSMNIAVKDSFNEGAKGAATGKLAGNLGRGGDHSYIDLDQSQAIQNYIGLLEFLKQQLSEISGISDQRLGQVENRETIGGVERSITQSSHITEWYFAQHEDIKLEAMRLLLDTAKIAYKGKSKKVQYVLDQQNIEMLNVDGDDLSSHEYGLVLTSDAKSQELENTLKEGAYAMLQRGELQLSTLIDLFVSGSIADKRRKIERKEREKAEEDARRFNEELEMQKAAQAQALDLENRKLDLEDIKNIRDNETKMLLKEADVFRIDEDDDRIELENKKIDDARKAHLEKMNLEKEKLKENLKLGYAKLKNKK